MPGAGIIGVAPRPPRRRGPPQNDFVVSLSGLSGGVAQDGTVLGYTENGGQPAAQRWQTSPDGTAWTDVPGATAATETVDIVAGRHADGAWIRVGVTIDGVERFSNTAPLRHVAPAVAGSLADQVLVAGTGQPILDAAGVFTGAALGFAISAPAGVSIDAATGRITFDTAAIAPQAGTVVTVTAANSGGEASAAFGLTLSAGVETDFVMTIEVADGETWTLPSYGGGTWNAQADMDDGAGWIDVTTFDGVTATYATGGIKTIRMRGQAHNIRCSLSPVDAAKIRTVESLGDLGWKDLIFGFYGCTGMTRFTAGNGDLTAVWNLATAFRGCTMLETCDLTGHTFPNNTNMRQMFANCPALTSVPGFNELDFGLVTQADECFENSPNVQGIDPSGFSILSLTSTGGMFRFVNDDVVLPQAVYDRVLLNYAAQAADPGLNAGVNFGFGKSPFTRGGAVEAARTALIAEVRSLTDGGNAVPAPMAAPTLAVSGASEIAVTRAPTPFSNGRPVTRFDLYQSSDGVTFAKIVTGMASIQPVTGLAPDTPYWFATTAVNYDGEGDLGAAATATTAAASGLAILAIGPQQASGEVPVTYTIATGDPAVAAVLYDAAAAQPLAADFGGAGAPLYTDLGTIGLTTGGAGIDLTLPDGELGNRRIALLPTGGGDADVVVSDSFPLDTRAGVLSPVSFVDAAGDVDWAFTPDEDGTYRVSLWPGGTNPTDAEIASGAGSVATVTGAAIGGIAETGRFAGLATGIYRPRIHYTDGLSNVAVLAAGDVTVATAGFVDPQASDPANLQWWDASDSARVTLSGTKVTRLDTRRSSGGNPLNFIVGSPQYDPATIVQNGRACIDCTPNSSLQNVALPMPSGDFAVHMALVLDKTVDSQLDGIFAFYAGAFRVGINAGSSSQFNGGVYGASVSPNPSLLSGGPYAGARIVSFVKTGNAFEVYVDNVLRVTGTLLHNQDASENMGFFVNPLGNSQLGGRFCAAAMTTDISAAMRTNYHDYLSEQWVP